LKTAIVGPFKTGRAQRRILFAPELLPIEDGVLCVLQVTIARSAYEMAQLRPLWQSLCCQGPTTVFQDFHWNLLALTMFAGREEPLVVCARASYGVAIVPAVLRHQDSTLRLLGEELFDYRTLLHQGDDEVLMGALAALAPLGRTLEIVALREPQQCSLMDGWLQPFSAAPGVRAGDISAEDFGSAHNRLARNLRRLERQGYKLKKHRGENSRLVREIYRRKAAQMPGSLFEDPLRVKFLVNAALCHPEIFEIFTLESDSRMVAALVCLHDGNTRRFYTGWFDPAFHKFSPAMALIYEVTRRSLAAGIDCDYMTGDQPYKLRLATRSTLLHRLSATPEQLADLSAARRDDTCELLRAG
jgi:CelD/BcsL family acetyltransferase involved in cellulose biosynthesis